MELTKSELEIMNVLWEAGRPLTRGEILELSVPSSDHHPVLPGCVYRKLKGSAGIPRCVQDRTAPLCLLFPAVKHPRDKTQGRTAVREPESSFPEYASPEISPVKIHLFVNDKITHRSLTW